MKRHDSGCFREEVEKVKIWFLSHNFINDVGGATNTQEAQFRNMINICTKYGFNILIISGIVMVDTDNGRRTTPWVWCELPTTELKKSFN